MTLRIDGIDCFYGNVQVLRDLSLELSAGEVLCLLGRNGAGKTTALRAIMGLMKPRAGDSFVVFGVGAVGLSGLMSAKIAGCDPIIAVDVHEHRLALARTPEEKIRDIGARQQQEQTDSREETQQR